MKRLIIAVLAGLMLSGCYAFQAKVCTAEGLCSEVKSRREYDEGFMVSYNPETGAFEFLTESRVTTNQAELQAVAIAVQAALEAYRATIPGGAQ